MIHAVKWTHCRYEGCQRKLKEHQEDCGFCGEECRAHYQEEKEFNQKIAASAFKREGELGGGIR